MELFLDRETFCELDLTEVGAYRYADEAEDLLLSYAIDDEPVQVWDVTEDPCIPDDLEHAMLNADEVWAHNAQFDKAVHNGPKQQHLPRIELERWRCSMALALSHALPGGLEDLCIVLDVPEDLGKLREGKKLIRLFTMPQPKNRKVSRPNRLTHPDEWARFKAYAANDISAMRECIRRMPRWNWDGTAVAEWHCDQRINERGFAVDRELTEAGIRAAASEKERIGIRFRELTQGVVDRPSQRAQFMAYLNEQFGLGLVDTKSDTFLQLLKRPTLDPRCAELMRLSIAANKTSTAKYAALNPAIQGDDRFRGALQFAGASRTRRWAGRLFQAHNLPARGLPKAADVEQYIETLKLNSHDLYFENLTWYGSAALRGVVVAPEDKILAVADLANIEGRILSWVSRENWKLEAFREYDAGTGPDLYNVTAVSIIGGDPWKVSKTNRQTFGKVPDLACVGADTLVLTRRGLVPIVDVGTTDQLWDGCEWVSHKGLSDNGVRSVVDVDGIEATPDHLINIKETWLQAQQLVSCESTLRRALATGLESFRSSGLNEAVPVALPPSSFSARAAVCPTLLQRATCDTEDRQGAISAPKQSLSTRANDIGATKTCAPTNHTDGGCSIGSQRRSTGAATPTMPRIRTMEVEASQSTRHGSKTDESSCDTCSRSQGGTSRCSNSIESMSTKDTCPETFDSSRANRIEKTSGACETCSVRSTISKRVYDLQNAGPRHRFLVKSRSGWLLIHNSGYQGGVAGYQTFAKAYNVRMADHWETIQKQISPHLVTKAWENLSNWGGESRALLEISDIEWVASETCKLAWRARHPATQRFWYELQDAMRNAINEWGSIHKVGPYIKVKCVKHKDQRWMVIRLPNGRYLTYFEPHLMDDRTVAYYGEAAEAGKTNRLWTRVFTHGGKATGNICQTLARDVLMPALQEAEVRGYSPVLSVHDEAVTEVPDNGEFDAEGLCAILTRELPWSAGLPLAAAGMTTYRYCKED